MSDDTTKGPSREFLAVKSATKAQSVPPPAVPPRVPTCYYCGQPLDAAERTCIFCPNRQPAPAEDVASPSDWQVDYGRRAVVGAVRLDRAIEVPGASFALYEYTSGAPRRLSDEEAARFLGLRNKTVT